ncbi:MAG: pseudouridine-5'-phosphate glycosidase [Chloroflexi bacterium]|nr:pseudouridine-5'-phosphate glycosidase [Chloroflexota bacterium]
MRPGLLRRYLADVLVISPEVAVALARGAPVVGLESTVITHGLPRPQNLELARTLEATVRAAGAVPATVALLGGKVRVGLSEAELQRLANAEGALKISRRDFGPAIARGADGGTTVAATMLACHRAGVGVFATGGIGGVHRGGPPETTAPTWDISADLPELARTPVVVVCAGAKAILDLPATLEWLETHGVPVIGYGVDEFPAFYSRESGLEVSARVDSPAEAAAAVRAQRALGLTGGVLVAVPCPAEAALPPAEAGAAIETALAQAAAQGVRGKAVTPFLLARVAELTGGRSLLANLALLENNARVAAEIAAALAEGPRVRRV